MMSDPPGCQPQAPVIGVGHTWEPRPKPDNNHFQWSTTTQWRTGFILAHSANAQRYSGPICQQKMGNFQRPQKQLYTGVTSILNMNQSHTCTILWQTSTVLSSISVYGNRRKWFCILILYASLHFLMRKTMHWPAMKMCTATLGLKVRNFSTGQCENAYYTS